ncbi:MAG: class E sortase, partial [Actinomycetota bacterium]|nr:class E sortase [Actinomycetota bacterium]
ANVAPADAAPSSSAMNLSVPALGISGVPVIDENSEAALTAGAMHLPGTGFPWQGEGSNTYVAGHRIGYPGTPSDRVFYDLPSMRQGDEVVLTDADGRDYTYAVTEMFAVSPPDTYVTSPIAGRDVVTLQTCTETVEDWTTIGPGVRSSGPGSGRLIVRADRVS